MLPSVHQVIFHPGFLYLNFKVILVEETGIVMSHSNLNNPTEVSTDLEITNTSDEQFENKVN